MPRQCLISLKLGKTMLEREYCIYLFFIQCTSATDEENCHDIAKYASHIQYFDE